MYDGVERIPINNLNFEQLRERVQILQDRYDTLIRRIPWLNSVDKDTLVDWANIRTPLIRAIVNRLQFTAQPDYVNIEERGHEPGTDPDNPEDKALIYSHNGLYWYWNGNEWKSTDDKNIFSEFNQTPAGFSLKGVLELLTDTSERLTISDSFIKMFPADNDGNPTYYPKIQIGYDSSTNNNCPIIYMGEGSSTETVEVHGFDIRIGQAFIFKDTYTYGIGVVGKNKIPMRIFFDTDPTSTGIFLSHVPTVDGVGKLAVDNDLNDIKNDIKNINTRLDNIELQITALWAAI